MFALTKRPPKVFTLGFVLAISALFTLIVIMPNYAGAQTAPTLGTAGSFAVLGGSTVTNTGSSIVNGNLGVAPGTEIVGFPPGVVTAPGTIHLGDAVALQAQVDVTTAANALVGQPCGVNLTGQDLAGLTLTPGVYCFDSSAQLSGNLTLDAQGSGASVFIFQIGSTLTTASAASVNVVNGGIDCNVWWRVGSSATLGTGTSFAGNILAQASVTLTTGATLSGRALAQTAAVTMDNNVIGLTNCTAQQPTHTLTATVTATATNTPDAVATATATATNTPDVVATATDTPGADATATNTPSADATATNTPGADATATNTPGAVATATSAPGAGATAVTSATSVPVAADVPAQAGISGLPNTGGGPPQATYWMGR